MQHIKSQFPILVNNTLTLNQGETVPLDSSNLGSNDLNNNQNNQTLFILSNIQHGKFSFIEDPLLAPITNFYQNQVSEVQFIHDGTPNPPAYQVSLSESGITIGAQAANIFFNYSPVLTNNTLSINQGQSTLLSPTNLAVTDPDDNSSGLQFIISDVQYGQFAFVTNSDSNPNFPAMQFTQDLIQNGTIAFIPDGSLNVPIYSVAVSDGKMLTPSKAGSITFNYAPILTVNNLAVNQGEAVVLTSTNLAAIDVNDPMVGLNFTISNIQHGQFALVSNPSIPLTNFIQIQVLGGQIEFIPDGSPYAPSYSVAVSDGKMAIASQNSTITFNFAPTLDANNLVIHQGQMTVLTSQNLIASDLDSFDGDLKFILSDIQYGQFAFVANPSFALTSFDQNEVQNGNIEFITDGSINAPSYRVAVSDGLITTTPQPGNFTFMFAPPVLTKNSLTVNQGQTVVLTPDNLAAEIPYGDAADLTFTVSNVTNGYFAFASDPATPIESFSQLQVQSRNIEFIPDGSSKAPSYKVGVSSNAEMPLALETSVISFNRAPIFVANNLTVNQGQSTVLTPTHLAAIDQDDSEANLLFIISNVQHGQFAEEGSSVLATEFNQTSIQRGAIEFIPDGTPNAPSFFVAINDGNMTTNAQQSQVNFNVAPILTENNLAVTQGKTVLLTSDNLAGIDLDSNAADLRFVVSDVDNGQFVLTSNFSEINDFTQKQVQSGDIAFATNGSLSAPSFKVALNDGQMQTAAQSSSISFSPFTPPVPKPKLTPAQQRGIGLSAASAAISFGLWGLKLFLQRKADQNFEKSMALKEGGIDRQQAEFQEEVIRPIARKIFDSVKMSGCFGYLTENGMQEYITAIESLVSELVDLEVSVDLPKMRPARQNRLLNEVTKQIRELIPKKNCCSCATLLSFFKAEVTPQQIEENVKSIAEAVKEVVGSEEKSRKKHKKQMGQNIKLRVIKPGEELKQPLMNDYSGNINRKNFDKL